MNKKSSPLPPYPRQLLVARFAVHIGASLAILDPINRMWGIEPHWVWLPHVGSGIFIVFAIYIQRATQRPFGPYISSSIRQKLFYIIAVIAIYAAIITSNVLAH